MCSSITPECGHTNSTIFLIGDVYCLNTKCSRKLCLHKNTFQCLSRSDYQISQCASVCQVCNIPFEEQTNSFFLLFDRAVYVFEASPKSIQDVIGDVYCPGRYSFNREKCETLDALDGCVTTPRSIQACGKCGACLFVHKVPFMLRGHVKMTKADKTCFFFAKKMNLVSNKQLLLNLPFQMTKFRKKLMCVDNKVQETIGDVFCPTCRNEKCIYISAKKRLVSTTVYSAKPAATF